MGGDERDLINLLTCIDRFDNLFIKNNHDSLIGSRRAINRRPYTTSEYAERFRCWLAQQQYIQQLMYYNYQMAVHYSSLPFLFQSFNKVPIQAIQSQPSRLLPQNNINQTNQQGVPCVISTIWKRYFAEILDFFFLFVVKITIALFIFDLFEMPDYDKMIDSVLGKGVNIRIPFEMIYIEIINKVFNTFFEAFCLSRGVGMLVGGQTPGKRIMGIRVVSCSKVTHVQGDNVLVFPAKDLGFTRSLIRSILKNLILLFPPLGVTAIFFPFYRAFYDRIAQSIVVDAEIRRDLRD